MTRDLTVWDPLREMTALRYAADALFRDSFLTPRSWAVTWAAEGVPVDVIESKDRFIVKAELPGVNPDELNIAIDDNVLTIEGQVKAADSDQARYHLRERRQGGFFRSIELPEVVDADRATADYVNGLLTLRLPKAPEAKPKRIRIGSGKPKLLRGLLRRK